MTSRSDNELIHLGEIANERDTVSLLFAEVGKFNAVLAIASKRINETESIDVDVVNRMIDQLGVLGEHLRTAHKDLTNQIDAIINDARSNE